MSPPPNPPRPNPMPLHLLQNVLATAAVAVDAIAAEPRELPRRLLIRLPQHMFAKSRCLPTPKSRRLASWIAVPSRAFLSKPRRILRRPEQQESKAASAIPVSPHASHSSKCNFAVYSLARSRNSMKLTAPPPAPAFLFSPTRKLPPTTTANRANHFASQAARFLAVA